MLAYDNRAVAFELLKPPAGAQLDFAVVLSYTLNLETLLALPLAIVSQQDAGLDTMLEDPLRLLQSIKEIGEHIHVFVDEAGVHVPRQRHPVFVALENSVHTCRAPNGGVFHPKIWIARFTQADGSQRVRIAVLSRNLTFDRSLDIALVSEALPGIERVLETTPIQSLLQALTTISKPRLSKELATKLKELGEQISCCEFFPPEGFHQKPIEFQAIGIEGFPCWDPRITNCKEVLAVTPFVSKSALETVAKLGNRSRRLISRREELHKLPSDVFSEWDSMGVLEDLNVGDEEENSEDANQIRDNHAPQLHAKLVVIEHSRAQASWILGSANITSAALSGKNVELVAHMSGRSKDVGIDVVRDSLKDLYREYTPQQQPETTDDEQQVRDELRLIRSKFLQSHSLRVKCEPDETEGLWRWVLSGKFQSSSDVDIQVWPISIDQNQRKNLHLPMRWSNMAEERLISLVAFRFFLTKRPDIQESFVLNLPISGMPNDRIDRVLRSVIDSTEKLLLFLRLILGGDPDQWLVTERNGTKQQGDSELAGFVLDTILEDLLRVASREPDRLGPFQRLISNLKETPEGRALIPNELEVVWEAISQAINR